MRAENNVTKEYYKFLDSADVDKVLSNGTIAVSSFEYFRKLEEQQWGLIADRLEGGTELTTEPMIVTENSPELAMLNNANIGLGMIRQFANLSGGATMNMGAVKFIHQIPGFIYCASVGHLDDLVAYMTKTAERKYDACLKIKDLEKLGQQLFDGGWVVGQEKPVPELFGQGAIGVVEYEERSRSIKQGQVLVPSPFKKAKHFDGQSEIRIFLEPKSGLTLPDRLIIGLDSPKNLFEQVAI
jgi:hypothetical protein